jgi:hypothetical protein
MRRRRNNFLPLAAVAAGSAVVGVLGGGVALLSSVLGSGAGCGAGGDAGAGELIRLDPGGSGKLVGATEYGGPGDSHSGTTGALGDNLLAHPDSFAELGGLTWQTATAMGGLSYMTPLRIRWSDRSVIAYKRDFGLGGPPVDGRARVIDLWWQLAGRLGIPYDDGLWSGTVRVQRLPTSGAGALLQASPPAAAGPVVPIALDAAACRSGLGSVLPLAPGDRAQLLPGGVAAAPGNAPQAVRSMIAAGNQIAGRPYVYGAGHGLPLSGLYPSYDCSSSVEHLLFGAGLIPVDDTVPSGQLESYGEPGPGRWVTLYASPDHVFMYVAGLRWDTHDAAGPGDGSGGIGWHLLVRDATGFVARHPPGL